MGIENFNNNSVRMRFWFEHAVKNITTLKGDIFEFGVYRGSSLLSMALLLKKLNSNKKIYAFDSFSGFPSYEDEDKLENFDHLFENKQITEQHYNQYKLSLFLKSISSTAEGELDVTNISSSGDFSENILSDLTHKIELLKLDNIILIEGDFKKTVPSFFKKNRVDVFSCNIDCDLYSGYKVTLPYVYNNLVVGGYVHLDEYYSLKFPGARIAIDAFCIENNIRPIKQMTPETEFERWYLSKFAN